ncbi:MAG: UMP kinase [Candidatus Paracaedibacteraceae bacterium]|nr:UMP kinase [Candidatus Paracaedibacteraceae bacterium]
MSKNIFKRVLLKLSGEALASLHPEESSNFGISQEMLERIALDIKSVHSLGIQIGIVVGGGNIFRGAHGVAQHDLDRTTSDHMGMLATVINGLALHNAIQSEGTPCRIMSAIPMDTIAESYIRQRAIRHMEKGRIVVFCAGSGNPYFTTDTAAALRASELGCDLLLKATKVDGVYSADPKTTQSAEFLHKLTYDEVVKRGLNVMDATAITLARENHIPMRVFSIYNEDGFAKVLQNQGRYSTIS